MKLIDSLKNKVIHRHNGTVTPKGGQKAESTSIVSEQTEKVELSKENLEKASEDLGEFKKTLEGKSEAEKGSLIKGFLSNHKDLSLLLVGLTGLQTGAITAQGFNHKEVMKSMETLREKLSPKNLKELSDSHDLAELKNFFADKHDVNQEIAQLKQLDKKGRLYKPTKIKGFLKALASGAFAAVWTLGVPAAVIYGLLHTSDPGAQGGMIAGGIFATGFANAFGWGFAYPKLEKMNYFNEPIGTADAIQRLDKHKTVEIKKIDGNAHFDKIKDLSLLSVIE